MLFSFGGELCVQSDGLLNQAHFHLTSILHKPTCSTCGLMNVPDMHEHVAEEAPHLCTVAGVIDQRALHEVRLIGLQHPLI